MKERRAAGATHSFRLSLRAAAIVDNISYPRSLGGKSKRVSDAIVWFWNTPVEIHPIKDGGNMQGTIGVPTAKELLDQVEELEERVKWWVKRCDEIQKQHDQEHPKKTLRGWVLSIIHGIIGR
tara:strand:- start:1929 stop:2297 length:369 start_codon:yes stop_codon:yes gene_type:complete